MHFLTRIWCSITQMRTSDRSCLHSLTMLTMLKRKSVIYRKYTSWTASLMTINKLFHFSHYDLLFIAACAFNTFATIFCSSIRNARTIRSRTHLWQRDPPYVLDTVFRRFDILLRSSGREGVIPCSFTLQSPHFGTEPSFFL